MPAAWDAQEELPGVQHRYTPRRRWGQPGDASPAAGADLAAARASPLPDAVQLPAAERQQHSGAPASLIMAVQNPLFGSSRPGTAEDVHGVQSVRGVQSVLGLQDVRDALPPKRCLVAARRRSSSESDGGGSGAASSPRQQRPRRRQRRSPELSVGPPPSLGSLGSGFSGEDALPPGCLPGSSPPPCLRSSCPLAEPRARIALP